MSGSFGSSRTALDRVIHGLVIPSGLDESLCQGTLRDGQGGSSSRAVRNSSMASIEPPAVKQRDAKVVVSFRRGRVCPHRLGEACRGVGPGRLRTAPDPALTPGQGHQGQEQDQSRRRRRRDSGVVSRPHVRNSATPAAAEHEAPHRREIAVPVRDEHRAHPDDARVGSE